MTDRTGGGEWDLAIRKNSESRLRLERLGKYRTPELVPLAICWVTGVAKPTGANDSILCLLAGWLAAESYYVTHTGL